MRTEKCAAASRCTSMTHAAVFSPIVDRLSFIVYRLSFTFTRGRKHTHVRFRVRLFDPTYFYPLEFEPSVSWSNFPRWSRFVPVYAADARPHNYRCIRRRNRSTLYVCAHYEMSVPFRGLDCKWDPRGPEKMLRRWKIDRRSSRTSRPTREIATSESVVIYCFNN